MARRLRSFRDQGCEWVMVGRVVNQRAIEKGCDFGYALAANSCERVTSVDACTVTALGAITTFAVPNPGGHLATPSVFSGLAVRRVASPEPITQRTSGRLHLCCQPFSAVDMSDPNTAIAIVNAEGWCKCRLFSCGNNFLEV